MAQEICKKLLPQADVFSRGIYANPSYEIPGKVTDFLSSQNITPSAHHSTQLTEKDLSNADLIFCMEQAHFNRLADRYAQYSSKLWLLNDFAFDKETDLEDPISLSGRAFIKQAVKLQKAVEAAAAKIKQEYGENK